MRFCCLFYMICLLSLMSLNPCIWCLPCSLMDAAMLENNDKILLLATANAISLILWYNILFKDIFLLTLAIMLEKFKCIHQRQCFKILLIISTYWLVKLQHFLGTNELWMLCFVCLNSTQSLTWLSKAKLT